jgi:hypothetical protein
LVVTGLLCLLVVHVFLPLHRWLNRCLDEGWVAVGPVHAFFVLLQEDLEQWQEVKMREGYLEIRLSSRRITYEWSDTGPRGGIVRTEWAHDERVERVKVFLPNTRVRLRMAEILVGGLETPERVCWNEVRRLTHPICGFRMGWDIFTPVSAKTGVPLHGQHLFCLP